MEKFFKDCDLKTIFGSLCSQRIKHNLYEKMKFLKQVKNIEYQIIKIC